MSSRDPGAQGGEDTTRNEQHVRAAEENRDALAAQARRTEATTDLDTTSRPVEGIGGGTSGGGYHASSGARPGADAAQSAAENRDALADESRRVEETLPDGIEMRDE
jgi:hypothetical protein